jgi:hypothetical protein
MFGIGGENCSRVCDYNPDFVPEPFKPVAGKEASSMLTDTARRVCVYAAMTPVVRAAFYIDVFIRYTRKLRRVPVSLTSHVERDGV